MKMRVNELCIGCGLCASVCPEIFQMDDDSMMAVASEHEVPVELGESAEEAKNGCPVSAIEEEEY